MHRKGEHRRRQSALRSHLPKLRNERPMTRVHTVKKAHCGGQLAPIDPLGRVVNRPHACPSMTVFWRANLACRRFVWLSRNPARRSAVTRFIVITSW